MSVGCNLLLTEQDQQQIEASTKNGREAEATDFVKEVILEKKEGWENRLTEALANPNHPGHKIALNVALKDITGNQKFDNVERAKLARSLVTVTQITPNILGLVHPAKNYGPRASAVLGNLTHKTRGYAFAYEINGTAALINAPSKAGNGNVSLHISPSDRVDMGIKLQASYAGLNRANVEMYRPKRGTVEADTFVDSKSRGTLGIDFKFASTGRGSVVEESQLQGVFNAIRTGEVQEFHFVANGTFGITAKNRIANYNETLQQAESKSQKEYTKGEVEDYFTKQEKEAHRSKPSPKIFWHENVKP